ncbi:MAG: site-specific DNA-methyltransferase, partial [Eubacteriales bacterium]|nr:site-specific DNA-methyltransferase [Eubacteriales bacterium]
VWGTKGQHREQTAKCLPGVFRMPANCEEKYHMTGKPIALLEQLLEICKPGGLVLDPFIGSGSTAVACKRTGRHYIGIEIVPDYIPIIEQRLANVPASLFSFGEVTG